MNGSSDDLKGNISVTFRSINFDIDGDVIASEIGRASFVKETLTSKGGSACF